LKDCILYFSIDPSEASFNKINYNQILRKLTEIIAKGVKKKIVFLDYLNVRIGDENFLIQVKNLLRLFFKLSQCVGLSISNNIREKRGFIRKKIHVMLLELHLQKSSTELMQ
jgi:hypothetical protein